MGSIVWLASYPKSGNTWLRALLGSLVAGGRAVDINALHGVDGAPARLRFDEVLGIDSADLLTDEAENLRPRVYEAMAGACEDFVFIKIHDALLPTPAGELLAPATATRGVVYVVRHPYAVAPSLANHLGVSVAEAVELMNDERFAFSASGHAVTAQTRQRLLDWSGHAASWIDGAPFPVHLVRYEDLHRSPARELGRLATFLGWSAKPGVLRRAVSAASFDRMRSQEKKAGFREAPPGVRSFFRRGKVDSWKKELSGSLREKLHARHAAMMRRLRYDP